MASHQKKISILLQDRYAITRNEADRQACNFLEKTLESGSDAAKEASRSADVRIKKVGT